jgi:large subunit ribosomal protein L25
MPEIALAVDARTESGSAASRRLRASGRIPAIVYGHGADPLSITVDGRALRTALTTEAGTNALLRLELGETQYLAMAREIQRHPVRHTVSHVDFQIVRHDEITQSEVSLTLVGEATAVHRGEGTVGQEFFTIAVKARPADLPSHLELDISSLEIGDRITVAGLDLPEGVTIDLEPETVLVVAHPPRVRADEAEEGEVVEGAEAAEGEGASAGAAESAGGSADSSSS